jgi:hypothetical protein
MHPFCLLDPDRRSTRDSSRNWDPTELRPGLDECIAIAAKYRGALIKLPPAADPGCLGAQAEAEFLGSGRDCRELLVRLGACVQQPGIVRARRLDTGDLLEAPWVDLASIRLPLTPMGPYLYEPLPVALRSHLFLKLGTEQGLGLLDPHLAWMTGEELPAHPFLRRYRMLGSASLEARPIKALLQEHDIGELTLKKRGILVDLEEWHKKLGRRPAGVPGVLMLTRLQGHPIALLGQRLEAESDGGEGKFATDDEAMVE